jgi:hypothetical protein
MINVTGLQYHAQHSTVQFAGRFKSVSEKKVDYSGKSIDFFMKDCSQDPSDPGPPFALSAVTTGAGVGASIFSSLPIPTVTGVVGAVLAGLAMPVGSGLTAAIMDRKVTYSEKQIPMTPEEEWAVMSPLEQAHFKVDEALKKWESSRQVHQNNLGTIETYWKKLEQDRHALEQELERVQRNARVKHADAPLNHEINRLTLQLETKTKVCEEQKKLHALAKQMFETLNQEILVHERKLYETKESLEMMSHRNLLLKMHQDIQGVKGQTQESPVLGNLKDDQNKDLAMALEKQKIEIEALMASVKTAMDVDAVLKSMSK